MSFPRILVSCVGVSLALLSGAALAEFPDRPIRLVVPFPPGGSVDSVARVVSIQLSERLKQQVVIDYKPGAATIVGAEQVARAAPDGYTLLLGTSTTFVVNPIIYSKLNYNPESSFDPIGMVGSASLVLLANSGVAAQTLPQLLTDINAKPGTYSYGSHGTGSTVNFAGEMLWNAAGVKVLHVPYKGSAPAMTDVMGGQIPLSFDAVPASVAALKSGKVRALAVTGTKRNPMLPNVPTIAESGFPGFRMDSWFAVVAPKGVPAPVKQKLVAELAGVMAEPAVQEKLVNLGFDPEYGTPGKYTESVRADTKKLAPVAKANNMMQD
ncbi:Bug family tripartite tricarboxylate transporter substrate binding protein [Cupriavidus plantarum]|uniref:Tripartite-type tricarboxylate transporter receptor subunit TctC n=1 Tax=Cupriavidus plantarum TaxID=942865 RepID=A0A316ER31_9BURK|nr:tripartite tricarboxylate transporter substrate binding protein [Cupriavidus plantarum]NYI02464.1 tripartite-type tricarboxylate transporter receptor subunit TctC [Cupriavidus plantarum]PWK33344.1 tripartite-type tricarboxylate transporter receptor subunit TctC [Cupriavidus plantarum]REE87719.1 tripartite-type tricarboxylate transporter receptor subunit TctC [Cupriavidus plantarum]RLK30153.1 tripartite-type tricarboxylate transporter receptor subunit TctC [Cupriavidus plantarum]CAG2145443.1